MRIKELFDIFAHIESAKIINYTLTFAYFILYFNSLLSLEAFHST